MSQPMKSIRIAGTKVQAQAVGFDKDGTLFDAVSYWRYIDRLRMANFTAVAGVEHAAEWSKTMGFTAPDKVDYQGVLALASTQEEIILVAGLLYRIMGWPWPRCREAAGNIFADADDAMVISEAFRPQAGFPEAVPMLKNQGFHVGIMTSDSYRRTKACMEQSGVTELLDYIITPEQVERGKPEPDMVHKACGILGIEPAGMVVVGDSVVDMQMAKKAGAIAVGLVTHEGSRQWLSQDADILIESLREIEIVT
jgi:phosphoglycolate phosphatase